jgi:antitoxin YefM
MTTTYSQARENLAALWDEVENAREPAIISRRGHEDMAFLPAVELRSLQETAYLLRSPRNAARLLAALEQSRQGAGTSYTVEALARAVALPEGADDEGAEQSGAAPR